MPKVLRNYYMDKGRCVLLNIVGVFPDMPTGLCDLGKEYIEPVVVELENKQVVIFEKEELERLIEEKKRQDEEKAKAEVNQTKTAKKGADE